MVYPEIREVIEIIFFFSLYSMFLTIRALSRISSGVPYLFD